MGKKVALIDDDENAVKFLSVLLSENGFDPIVAHDGREGRKMVEAVIAATSEDWQLAVVMDWSGGFWRKMAQEHPRLAVF